MSDLHSRAAAVGMTTGAVLLLALPVVASGQVPVVDQVVGGVNQAAQGVIQAAPAPPAPPAPPVKLPAPAPAPRPAPAPAPAASAPAPAAPAPSASAPASAPTPSATGSQASGRTSGSGGSRGGTTARASGKKAHRGSHVHALAASDKKASASQDSGTNPTDTQIADDPTSIPPDASPATLPFTGLQLALMGMLGMAAIAGGAALRRGVRARRA
jgi:outer membrane biosynthesis protein TonB